MDFWRHGVDVSDGVTTTKALRRVNEKMIFLCQQVTHKNNLQRETCSIILTDVNIASKRAFLQKVTVLLKSTTEMRG